jgi:hypothetical protein
VDNRWKENREKIFSDGIKNVNRARKEKGEKENTGPQEESCLSRQRQPTFVILS